MNNIENKVVNKLIEKNYTISTAESITGGMIASTIINVSGSSKVIKESYVTYSDEAKEKILNVKHETIEKYSVYSNQVAVEMATGLAKISGSNVCIGVTGEAESKNGMCTSYYAICLNGKIYENSVTFNLSRNEVRRCVTNTILEELYKVL